MSFASAHRERIVRALGGQCVCVTGGAGFIGRCLTQALLDVGAQVTVIDDLSTGDGDALTAMLEQASGQLRFVYASILDTQALAEAVTGARVVFHLAAEVSVPASIETPERCFAVNAMGSVRVAEAARDAGAGRWVVAASCSAYGLGAPPNVESDAPQPLSPYAASKLAAEHVVTAWAHSCSLPGAALRLFNVYGPGQKAGGPYAAVVPAFAEKIKAGRAPVIYGDGEQTRDFVFVDDVAAAFLLAASVERPPQGEVVNIGSGRQISVNELARVMLDAAGRSDLAPAHERAREGEVRASCADNGLARRLLGWAPSTTFEEGIRRVLRDWGLGEGDPPPPGASPGAAQSSSHSSSSSSS